MSKGTDASVHRCFFVLFVMLLLGLQPQRTSARETTVLDRYAAVLRNFDPGLDDDRARRLAYRTLLEASAYRLDARLVVALVAVESSWDPTAVSSAGARGLGQLMPGTAADLRVDPDDPYGNLDGTIRHLRGLLDRYARYPVQARFERAIAAYNAGGGAVDRADGIPPYAETQAYVRRVIALWRRLAGR